ncbi:hypothetical protein [Amycolatopsis sp. WQ 127309]|uniref:hypothetical protein n=1 Tax=Amycolatopsis sp. WQ 127309 TaxID=2932773 RepID=UPI001FF2D3E1|nr:hypothetical protein [Amycolatopsis sp. WQ 127309]UOZ06894.1 hypothetical protein MUY22_00955 [Amycolatopsis sp. WQ 127309]
MPERGVPVILEVTALTTCLVSHGVSLADDELDIAKVQGPGDASPVLLDALSPARTVITNRGLSVWSATYGR